MATVCPRGFSEPISKQNKIALFFNMLDFGFKNMVTVVYMSIAPGIHIGYMEKLSSLPTNLEV